jgi:hypothetical protein
MPLFTSQVDAKSSISCAAVSGQNTAAAILTVNLHSRLSDKDTTNNMTRRTISLATSIAAAAFAFAPFTAQAADNSMNTSNSTVLSQTVQAVVDIQGPTTASFSALLPQSGSTADLPLTVDSNVPYTVTFTSGNTPAFNLVSSGNPGTSIPYTITNGSVTDTVFSFLQSNAAPDFALNVAEAAHNAVYLAGSYSDTLTYTIAPAA